MTEFQRKFDVDCVERLLDAPENAWFGDLLKRWRPAGDCPNGNEHPTQADHLRLAVRNGYLNLYRAGQSVAQVRIVNKCKLQAKIHRKYVFGKDCQPEESYVLVTDGGFSDRHGARIPYCEELLRGWIRAASDNEYAKEEKSFVDDLVAQNSGVIDLEAGLPWDPDIWSKRGSRRIDLVALEGCGHRFGLVFWEAKLVTNSEARSEDCTEGVRTVGEVQRWLVKNRKFVTEAYQRTCQTWCNFTESRRA